MYYKLAPSILVADLTRSGERVREMYEAGTEYPHSDMMGGAFVPSISFGVPVIKSLRPYTRAVSDVHMTVEEPGRYVEDMKNYGVDIITVRAEACTRLDRVVNQTKETELKAGIALDPVTSVRSLECILGQLDMMLIMAVNPGFGGQKSIPYTLDKVRELENMLNEQGLRAGIQVDGGINAGNVREVVEVRANILVISSAISDRDPFARTREFIDILREYEK